MNSGSRLNLIAVDSSIKRGSLEFQGRNCRIKENSRKFKTQNPTKNSRFVARTTLVTFNRNPHNVHAITVASPHPPTLNIDEPTLACVGLHASSNGNQTQPSHKNLLWHTHMKITNSSSHSKNYLSLHFTKPHRTTIHKQLLHYSNV
jgi:hypothetical protein